MYENEHETMRVEEAIHLFPSLLNAKMIAGFMKPGGKIADAEIVTFPFCDDGYHTVNLKRLHKENES